MTGASTEERAGPGNAAEIRTLAFSAICSRKVETKRQFMTMKYKCLLRDLYIKYAKMKYHLRFLIQLCRTQRFETFKEIEKWVVVTYLMKNYCIVYDMSPVVNLMVVSDTFCKLLLYDN